MMLKGMMILMKKSHILKMNEKQGGGIFTSA